MHRQHSDMETSELWDSILSMAEKKTSNYFVEIADVEGSSMTPLLIRRISSRLRSSMHNDNFLFISVYFSGIYNI